MSLMEHQRELLALARQQNILISGVSGVGKSFVGATLARESLQIQSRKQSKKIIVVVSNVDKIDEIYHIFARICSVSIAASTNESLALWNEAEYKQQQIQDARIFILVPSVVQSVVSSVRILR